MFFLLYSFPLLLVQSVVQVLGLVGLAGVVYCSFLQAKSLGENKYAKTKYKAPKEFND